MHHFAILFTVLALFVPVVHDSHQPAHVAEAVFLVALPPRVCACNATVDATHIGFPAMTAECQRLSDACRANWSCLPALGDEDLCFEAQNLQVTPVQSPLCTVPGNPSCQEPDGECEFTMTFNGVFYDYCEHGGSGGSPPACPNCQCCPGNSSVTITGARSYSQAIPCDYNYAFTVSIVCEGSGQAYGSFGYNIHCSACQ